MGIKVRPAVPADLEGIVELEEESWGKKVGRGSMASRRIIEYRIGLCNAESPGWFWVAEREEDGKILGSFVLQPTSVPPDQCVSWHSATDRGRLTRTFDPSGPFIYGVNLSVPDSAPRGTSDLLAHAIHLLRLKTGKPILYACAPMRGFQRAREKTGIRPDRYWALKKRDGTPKDASLHFFWMTIGMRPIRLLRRGYRPDLASGGHGVLCMSEDPMTDALNSAQRLLHTGLRVFVR
jgi:hypothetical protein